MSLSDEAKKVNKRWKNRRPVGYVLRSMEQVHQKYTIKTDLSLISELYAYNCQAWEFPVLEGQA